MDIAEQGRSAMQRGADMADNAAANARRIAGNVADRAQDMADQAWRGTKRAGRQARGIARERPVETALLGVAVGCAIAGLVLWLRRRD